MRSLVSRSSSLIELIRSQGKGISRLAAIRSQILGLPTYHHAADEVDVVPKRNAHPVSNRPAEYRRSRIDPEQFPWREASERFQRTLSPELQEVFRLLEAWSEDPDYVVTRIQLAPGCPEFPADQWAQVVQGLAVDLDSVFNGGVSRAELGACYRTVETHTQWIVAFNRTVRAVAFALPQREKEYTAWEDYMLRLFTSMQPCYHPRIIDFDKAARRRAADQKHLRLSDTAHFEDLRVFFVMASDYYAEPQGGRQSEGRARVREAKS